ncbi:MAG TPA: PAS domain-containing protein, partial [Smithellaceae bacterium]|nr:PAS domain-containing protein [Smithellaceae bacterium]
FAVAALSCLFEQSRQVASQKMNLALSELEKSKEMIEEQVRERTSQLFEANEKLLREIAERKQVVEALKKSEERLRFALEGANDGLWDVNMRTNDVFISPRGCEILGYRPDEMKELAKAWSDLVNPEDLPRTIERLNAYLDGHVPVFEVEQRLRLKSGDWKWVLSRGKVVEKDEKGLPVRMTGTHTDISKRKQAEEDKNKLEERLQRSEKMETMGKLAGGVAHDLNNVLGVLVGYSELMLLEIPEGHSLRRHVANIMNSGERAAAIIKDLLALARRGVAVAEVINLNNVIENYLNTPEFEALKARYPRVNYRINLERNLLNIKGSPVHIGNAIMNLIVNATEAITEQGEVKIVTDNRHLDKPVYAYEEMAAGDYAVLTVRDNGKGIAQKDSGKIFEPFYTKKNMGRSGTGLGLAVVWGTVKDHHGYIDIQSEENKGSSLSLYFPVTRAQITTERQHIPAEIYQGRGEALLIVDDVKEQRELAAAILNGLGYHAEVAASGEEALEYLKQNKADLLVLDMIMDPGIDGLTTYEGALKINPRQKAIIVSGFSETERVRKAQELGAGEYVLKPYIREHLGLAVRRELDRK